MQNIAYIWKFQKSSILRTSLLKSELTTTTDNSISRRLNGMRQTLKRQACNSL